MINQSPVIRYEITDNRIGIPEDEREPRFDAFIQSDKTSTGGGGTGLGLAICYQIFKGHQGKVWAEQSPKGDRSYIFIWQRTTINQL